MNFETKYILRYGIPGWIYILFVTSYLIIIDSPIVINYILNGESLSLIGFGAILAGVGVPIGYLIHLISLCFSWIKIKDWDTYFNKELELDRDIINLENGDKLRERYRYLLSQVHGLKALLTSLSLVLITTIILMLTYKFECYVLILIGIVIFLIWVVNKNREYYQSNLDHFLNNKFKLLK